ncbi:palmitoyltransferase ZDHHC24 [Biomphalaria pfeifferi]|uniref:Palmitoyltransferase n=1 Tax=Biomphalaria pfeifferi TaxID=112525 RepID=A0AAD8C577_BIOPF|nr:palmitoyltransferase ZDHHC24 [Biomphalaria pfeifferi]
MLLLLKCLPKTKSDIFAFCFLLGAIHSIGFFELLVVLPSIYSTPAHHGDGKNFTFYYFHVFIGIYLYCNVMHNLYKVMTTPTNISSSGKILPSVLKPGWHFCSVCECNAPPRSFHCFICKSCILKRDHHCTFTGNCIGLYNHRYYISLVFHMFLAAAYSCFLNWDFMYHLLGSMSLKSIIVILLPMVSWIFFQSDSMTTFQTLMTSLCVVGLCLCGGLVVYHLINAINGQIVHERVYKVRTYDLGWKENLALLLGTNWKVAWLCPMIKSPIPCDGLDFVTRDQYESLKSM